jgi:hypothetical protein
MELYTDRNPITTLKGLGYKNEKVAKNSIKLIEIHFSQLYKKQKLNSWTPFNVKPKKFITNKTQSYKYYQTQKMYRVLGLVNRAKGMVHRIDNNKQMIKSIKIFEKWMQKYKNNK